MPSSLLRPAACAALVLVLVACGGSTAAVVDGGDGGGGADGAASDGGLACHDGTSRTTCCVVTPGTPCDGSVPECFTPCSPPDAASAWQGHYLCSGGRWNAGKGLFPCTYSP